MSTYVTWWVWFELIIAQIVNLNVVVKSDSIIEIKPGQISSVC